MVLMMGLCASAQYRGGDSFFNDWNDVGNGLDNYNTFDSFDNGLRGPGTPGHGGGDQPAPLGSGLVILGALGAGYAVAKRKREE